MKGKKHAEIENKLVGKTIIGVVYDDFLTPDYDENDKLSIDACEICILLSDGTKIKTWNSEWGGIQHEVE